MLESWQYLLRFNPTWYICPSIPFKINVKIAKQHAVNKIKYEIKRVKADMTLTQHNISWLLGENLVSQVKYIDCFPSIQIFHFHCFIKPSLYYLVNWTHKNPPQFSSCFRAFKNMISRQFGLCHVIWLKVKSKMMAFWRHMVFHLTTTACNQPSCHPSLWN